MFLGNKSDRGLREVAGEVLCLHDLTVPDVCCDFFYQGAVAIDLGYPQTQLLNFRYYRSRNAHSRSGAAGGGMDVVLRY